MLKFNLNFIRFWILIKTHNLAHFKVFWKINLMPNWLFANKTNSPGEEAHLKRKMGKLKKNGKLNDAQIKRT